MSSGSEAGERTRRLEEGKNVLVLGDELERDPTAQYLELLTSTVDDPGELNVLRVVYTSSLSELWETWMETVGTPPNHMHVVRAQDRQLGTVDDDELPDRVSTAAINPNDLTGMAIRLRNGLSELSAPDAALAFGFDSLTPLLQYNDITSTYKFLHLTTGQLAQANAVSAFRLDPRAFEDQTVNKLRSLFDSEVRFDDDGQD